MRLIYPLALFATIVVFPSAQPRATLADHVLVIGIDGLGSEGLQSASAPVIRALMADGAHTLAARAVMPTVSSPNWASMITGAGPEQHGVTSNEWERDRFDVAPVAHGRDRIFPTMFGEARSRRRDAVIGIFHDWDGFGRLVETRVADELQDGDGPVNTVDRAVAFLRSRRPTLTFVHLDHVDHAGHEFGWMSEPYMNAIADADRLIGRLLAALDAADIRSRTAVIVSADHGGVGTKHGGLTRVEIEIPWIVQGPGVRRGHVITTPVSTVDTAPTVLHLLGLSPHAAWIGRPVAEAFLETR